MRTTGQQAKQRGGFTLIELMVVMAIMAALMAIAAGAYFRVMESQNKKRSETTVKKVMTGLDSQWMAAIDDIKDEIKNGRVPPKLVSLMNGDRDSANVVYMKARLKQEFPVNFNEIRNPLYPLTSGTLFSVLTTVIKPKLPYVSAISGATGLSQQQEAAVCLFLALSQTRRGATFNADDVGAANIKTIPTKTVQVFVDGWAKPDCTNAITYERWVQDDAALLGELDAMIPTTTAKPSKDPQDPQGKLFSANPPVPATERASLQSLLHPLDNHNRSPFIRCAGADQVFNTATTPSNDDMLSFRMVKEGRSGN